MEGIGNDYVYINNLNHQVKQPAAFSRKISDRHFGIGSDGLILIEPSDQADFKMAMYNADGSEGKMCGNGIRCFAKYVYDHHLSRKTELRIETLSGIKTVQLLFTGDTVHGATVDMGEPSFDPKAIPLKNVDKPVIDQSVKIGDTSYECTILSMGNPHCVIYVDQLDTLAIETIGPAFEHDPLFIESVNTEFVKVIDRQHLSMRVWERGSNETMACGTGACAAMVASHTLGLCDNQVDVHLLGGHLTIRLDSATNHVFLSGPATTVFEGTFIIEGEETNG